jgi:anthranilate/para-aminobenzoate synthase component I
MRAAGWVNRGQAYQVNYTMRQPAAAQDDPKALFRRSIRRNEPTNSCAAPLSTQARCHGREPC